jgi:hypothetical protein
MPASGLDDAGGGLADTRFLRSWLQGAMLRVRRKATVDLTSAWADVMFPYERWQRTHCGSASQTPFTVLFEALQKWVGEGRIAIGHLALNDDVRPLPWARIFRAPQRRAPAWDEQWLVYNQGHGSEDRIYTGGGHYITPQFVRRSGWVPRGLVYAHSCSTLGGPAPMAEAFLDDGADAYVGWKGSTCAHPDYCDRLDGRFFEALFHGATTGDAYIQAAEAEDAEAYEDANVALVTRTDGGRRPFPSP